VPLTGTCVCLLTSEKKDGNSPSRAMAISILGCEKQHSRTLAPILEVFSFNKLYS
jgi:hypothetical protein